MVTDKLLNRRQRAYCRWFCKREVRRGAKKTAISTGLASRFEVSTNTIRRVLGNEYSRQDNIDSDDDYLNTDRRDDNGDGEDGNQSQRKVRPATLAPRSNYPRARSNTTTAIQSSSARAPPCSSSSSARIVSAPRRLSPPPCNKASFKELLHSLELEHLVETFEDRGFESALDIQRFRHLSRSTRQYIFGILYNSGLVDLKELALLYDAFDSEVY